MGRTTIIAIFFAVICLATAAQAAQVDLAGAELLQGSLVSLSGIAAEITEPRALVLGGICVIAFSWYVRRKSRMRR
jgi:hypothetical protein